jgi:hypothetical protein
VIGAGGSSTVPAIASQPADPNRRTIANLPVTKQPSQGEGIEEKFGKFGLPPQDPSRYRWFLFLLNFLIYIKKCTRFSLLF